MIGASDASCFVSLFVPSPGVFSSVVSLGQIRMAKQMYFVLSTLQSTCCTV